MGRQRRPSTYQGYKQMCEIRKQRFFIVSGICLFVAGLIMHAYPDLSQPFDSAEETVYDEGGPIIWVACNKPNQQAHVTVITDVEGRTDLAFQRMESDADDVKVWIIINDDYAPFMWSTMKNATAVRMYTQDGKAYFSEPRDSVYGTGNYARIRMDFGEDAGRVHTIRIEPEDYIVKKCDKCWLRVPRIGPWYNRNVSKDFVVNLPYDDPKWIDKTMDGEELYFLDMEISAVVHNPASKDSDLVLELFSPRGKESDSAFDWITKETFLTQIHYIDEGWQRTMDQLDMLSSVFFGLGLSFIYLVFADRRKKVEEGQ